MPQDNPPGAITEAKARFPRLKRGDMAALTSHSINNVLTLLYAAQAQLEMVTESVATDRVRLLLTGAVRHNELLRASWMICSLMDDDAGCVPGNLRSIDLRDFGSSIAEMAKSYDIEFKGTPKRSLELMLPTDRETIRAIFQCTLAYSRQRWGNALHITCTLDCIKSKGKPSERCLRITIKAQDGRIESLRQSKPSIVESALALADARFAPLGISLKTQYPIVLSIPAISVAANV